MKIGSKEINVNKKPVLISEISGNHGGSLSNAIKLIKLAAKNGTDLIKLQTYEADNLTLNCATNDFLILDNNSLWKNKRLYELYKKGETKKEWHQKLFAISRKCNVECFSSIFSEKDIPFLENLKIPAYKVASFENNHYPLIEKLIETKKPILVSTGLNSFSENLELINFFRKKNYKNFALLKCTSSYPADFKNLNLQTITDMRKKFQCEIGFSDHSIGKLAAYGSIFCGASFVEKHIRLKKNLGIDAKFSLDVSEIKSLKKL